MAIQRGIYSRGLSPTKAILAAFKILTPPLQYLLITSHPLSRFNFPPPPSGGTLTIPPVTQLGLGPFTLPKYPLMMSLMPAVLASKHIYWLTHYCNEPFTWQFALGGGLVDLIYETITSLVFTTASSNPLFSPLLLQAGFGLYVSAVIAELVCELQRDRFKRDPKNKGRICDEGLWGWVRHPNYTANVVFGFAYGLAAGGWGYALCTGGMYLSNLGWNAGPALDEYMKGKYGERWEIYRRKVRWSLLPGVK